MTIPTNAILCYGYDLGESGPWAYEMDEQNFDDHEEYLAVALVEGFEPRKVGEGGRLAESYGEWSPRLAAASEAHGMAMEEHCSSSYPEYALVVKASVTTARRGYPVDMNLRGLEAKTMENRDKARAAYAKLFPDQAVEEPKWILMSYWGR